MKSLGIVKGDYNMSDYLIWAAERLETKYGWNFEDAQEWLVSTNYIPYDISLQKYIEECGL